MEDRPPEAEVIEAALTKLTFDKLEGGQMVNLSTLGICFHPEAWTAQHIAARATIRLFAEAENVRADLSKIYVRTPKNPEDLGKKPGAKLHYMSYAEDFFDAASEAEAVEFALPFFGKVICVPSMVGQVTVDS